VSPPPAHPERTSALAAMTAANAVVVFFISATSL
jgi:hypothetical protein